MYGASSWPLEYLALGSTFSCSPYDRVAQDLQDALRCHLCCDRWALAYTMKKYTAKMYLRHMHI
jgi:hypothetical protein